MPEELTTLLPGDPSTWTPAERTRNERMAAFLRELHTQGILQDAATAAGVDQATVWRWREQYPAFGDAVTRFLTRTRQAMIEDNMFRIATSSDPKMANAAVKAGEFYLRALDRDQYTERQVIEQTVTVNQQVQLINQARDRLRAERQARVAQLGIIDAEQVRSDPPPLPAPTP